MRHVRTVSLLRQGVGCAVLCAAMVAPQAAADTPRALTLAALSMADGAFSSGGEVRREVVPVREPQIVVTRLPVPGPLSPESGAAGQGTMLLALGAMLVWITARRS